MKKIVSVVFEKDPDKCEQSKLHDKEVKPDRKLLHLNVEKILKIMIAMEN